MSPASDKKSNFFFANCLHCEGIIRVPIAIRPESQVNCPHCSSQFKLVDFMDQIPEVEVVAGDVQNGTASLTEEFHIETEGIEKQDGKFVVPPQLAAGIRKRRRRRRRSESSQNGTPTDPSQMSEAEELKQARRSERAQRQRDKIQQQREQAAALADPRKRRPSKRSAAPKRNPVLEGFKIILGGLLAAPIAYLLLMWVFAKDPLNLRNTIYNTAPFLVPESLVEEGDSIPEAAARESEESLRGLPVPQTDPDDVDPMKVDLDIE